MKEGIPKLIFWDFDGTLADTKDDVWDSLRYAARRIGCHFSMGFESDNEHLSLPISQILMALEPPVGMNNINKFNRDVCAHYQSISTHQRTQLYPGMEVLLQALHGCNVLCYIVTNKPKKALERLLTLKAWNDLFDGWVTSDMGEMNSLTKEQMIHLVLNRTGISSACSIMIGDSWGDIRGAHLAGIACVGVTYGDGDTNRLLAEKPDYIATNVPNLAQFLLEGKHD